MRGIRSGLRAILAIGLLAGSAVGVTAQEETTAVEFIGATGFGPCSTDYCDNPIVEPFTDPRLAGQFRVWANDDAYGDGPTLWMSGFSMHDDEGGWIQRPSLGITHSNGEPSTEVITMDGQGAYDGLTLVAEVSLTGSTWDWHGYIVDGELPPAPVIELPAEPDAIDPAAEEAQANITELQAALGARLVDLTVDSPSVGERHVRLLLPADWDEQPEATWPSLYLLHGQGGDYTNWTEDTDIALRLADELELDVLLVMPDGGASYYSDWWNLGAANDENAWATFHIEELPQILEADWRADDRRAVAGLSMGGFGAMSYAARYPGHFRAAASYSGVLDPLGSDWFHHPALWGDKEEQREIWEAHDPVTLAENLAGIPLYVSWGDGTEEVGGDMVDDLEAWLATHSEAFVARLDELGIPVTVESGIGTHTWDTWNPAFESSLPMLLEALDLAGE